jgi:hypothetical protein
MLRNAGLSGAAGFAGVEKIDIATFSALNCVSYTAFCGVLRDMVPNKSRPLVRAVANLTPDTQKPAYGRRVFPRVGNQVLIEPPP